MDKAWASQTVCRAPPGHPTPWGHRGPHALVTSKVAPSRVTSSLWTTAPGPDFPSPSSWTKSDLTPTKLPARVREQPGKKMIHKSFWRDSPDTRAQSLLGDESSQKQAENQRQGPHPPDNRHTYTHTYTHVNTCIYTHTKNTTHKHIYTHVHTGTAIHTCTHT